MQKWMATFVAPTLYNNKRVNINSLKGQNGTDKTENKRTSVLSTMVALVGNRTVIVTLLLCYMLFIIFESSLFLTLSSLQL